LRARDYPIRQLIGEGGLQEEKNCFNMHCTKGQNPKRGARRGVGRVFLKSHRNVVGGGVGVKKWVQRNKTGANSEADGTIKHLPNRQEASLRRKRRRKKRKLSKGKGLLREKTQEDNSGQSEFPREGFPGVKKRKKKKKKKIRGPQ